MTLVISRGSPSALPGLSFGVVRNGSLLRDCEKTSLAAVARGGGSRGSRLAFFSSVISMCEVRLHGGVSRCCSASSRSEHDRLHGRVTRGIGGRLSRREVRISFKSVSLSTGRRFFL